MVSKSGYNKCTAAVILYSPHYLGGANLFHLYDDQGYGQVQLFMKSWRSSSSQMGHLTRIAMAWAQFCAGTGTPILENTITKLPHAEAKWIMSMRDFLTATQGTIELLDHSAAKLQREQDAFLMDIVL
jgi:hypothetical protein